MTEPRHRGRVRARARRWMGAWLGVAIACGQGPTEGRRDLSREEFIEVYVALLRAEAAASDSADARARKGWVLERRRLTPADVEAFALKHADEPELMTEIWTEIERRIRESARDTVGTPEVP